MDKQRLILISSASAVYSDMYVPKRDAFVDTLLATTHMLV